MNNKPLDLWYAYPDDLLSEQVAEACALLLSEDEQARWKRFRFPRHAREFLATRALVRTALSHYDPRAPAAWRFQANEHGKPAAEQAASLCFNLSNSPGLVVCLISHGAEVGVDVEPHERADTIAELAPDVFSPLELAQLEELRGIERADRALSLWTLKEAYIKARGLGLALPLNKFSYLFGGAEGIRLELDPSLGDEPGRWRFCLLDHAGHRIALMAEHATAPAVQMWETRLLPATPIRTPVGGEPWFPRVREATASGGA
jgi:4'-phosphopantetheinyl transferase